MSKNKFYSHENIIPYKGLGTAIGLLFGCLVSLIIGNPIIFASGCMVLGLAIGTTLDSRNR